MSETIVSFRPIPGFGPGYRVGDDGSVWSCHIGGLPRRLLAEWRRLKCPVMKGYHTVLLATPDFKKVCRRVHTLVLLAFVGPCPEGLQCRHLDGDPLNNRLENLCWGTAKENAADRTRHGTGVRGERTPNARFTDEQVRAIKRQLAAGRSPILIAAEHRVHVVTIRHIAKGRSWKHVEV